jgi:alpha-galactosidase
VVAHATEGKYETAMNTVLSVIAYAAGVSAQVPGPLAQTPPMGWNSWNRFACRVDEQLIRATADAMVKSGMKDAGYRYINIDDCWQAARDPRGFIQPDGKRFPSGMKALADYIHAKGLKMGLYSDAGAKTCGGREGSRGHEYQDALTYAGWGVDYLKYDWCNADDLNAQGAYTTMHDALGAAGRRVVFSVCEWGNNKPWEWAPPIAHLWRTTGDIYPCFDCKKDHGTWYSWGVLQILDLQKGLRQYAGPGHWNDPDMLEVGNGMALHEDRAHFSLWSMLAAPLIAGNDLRAMPPEVLAILTNRDVIAVDQDKLGIAGFAYATRGGVELWFRPLDRGAWAMCGLNRTARPQKLQLDWRKEAVVDDLSKRQAAFATTTYRIRDLWTKQDLGTTEAVLNAEVPSHDVLMVRLDRTRK